MEVQQKVCLCMRLVVEPSKLIRRRRCSDALVLGESLRRAPQVWDALQLLGGSATHGYDSEAVVFPAITN